MKNPKTRKSAHINLYGEDIEVLDKLRHHLQKRMGTMTKVQVVRYALFVVADREQVNLSK